MNVFRTTTSLICCCAGLIALSAASASAAEVIDDGSFFTADAIRGASEKIQELNHRHGFRVKVETIAALPANESDEVRKMSAGDRAKFFGRFLSKHAAAEKVDLLIFASRDPRYLQVLPHKKLESAGFTTAMRDKLASALIAGFHAQKYDEALSSAVTQLEQDFLAVHRAAPGPVQSHSAQLPVPVERAAARPPAESSWLVPIVLAVALVGGFLLVRRLMGGAGGGTGVGNNTAGGGAGGGGGFMGNIVSGMFGAVAGNWLYDSFLRPTAHGQDVDHPRSEGGWLGSGSDPSSNASDYTPDSYDVSGGGGDFDGGGDVGGGDDGGGGDF